MLRAMVFLKSGCMSKECASRAVDGRYLLFFFDHTLYLVRLSHFIPPKMIIYGTFFESDFHTHL